jgi:predicted transcriptional regulator
MASTRSATLSIRLKPEIKKRLARLAKVSGRSSNFLISDAVESYVADQERMLAEIRQSDRQVKSGHYRRARGDEGMAAVMGNRPRTAAAEVRVRRPAR